MAKILKGIKNGDLRLALAAREEHFEHAPSGILEEQYGRH